MAGYNRLNGTYCSEDPWLLTQVLRDEWGFEGLVVSDWFGSHSAAESLRAGLDLEMPGPPQQRGPRLLEEVAARRRQRRRPRQGRGSRPCVGRVDWRCGQRKRARSRSTMPVTRDVIRQAAIQGMVLLKNEDGLLPLAAEARRIALIGPYARHGRVQGGGSARVRPEHGRGPLEALQARQLDVTVRAGRIDRQVPADRAR